MQGTIRSVRENVSRGAADIVIYINMLQIMISIDNYTHIYVINDIYILTFNCINTIFLNILTLLFSQWQMI